MSIRFDICEAYAVLEWDYNVGGWLRERPSNQRRKEATAVQLARMGLGQSPLKLIKSAYYLDTALMDYATDVYWRVGHGVRRGHHYAKALAQRR